MAVDTTLLDTTAVIFVAIWGLIIKRMGGAASGFLEIGKSKAKVYLEKETRVTFADVAGVDEAKASCKEIVALPQGPDPLGRLGAHACPRACCWSGRPAPARPCLRARSPAKPGCRSSRSTVPSSSRCSSAWGLRGSATCSSRRASGAGDHLHRRAGRAGPARGALSTSAATTRRNRR